MTLRHLLSFPLLAALAAAPAFATNGYLQHGYGVKSQGMAGVGIALPQDGLAAATNPAGTAFVGNRVDVGAVWFRPSRGAEISGNGAGLDGRYDGNDTRNFFIPELGYVRQFGGDYAFGVAVYGNGGMNTDYSRNPFRSFGAQGNAGIDLAQVFVSPSLAWRITPDHAVGVAVNLAWQQFKAKGIQPFAGFSAAPGQVSDQGRDDATGWGLRLGYTGRLSPTLTVGLTWASKTRMGDFDKYRGLFAEGGGFDVPENYGAGLAWQATRALTLAADVQRIEYSGVPSVGRSLAPLFAGNPLGSDDGPGFGWRDVTVWKLGASYDWSDDLTLRAGYSHVSAPVPAGQTLLNILAPGVVRDHASVGATWKTAGGELSLSYTRAFRETVRGSASIPAVPFGGGEADVHLSEHILGIAWGRAL